MDPKQEKRKDNFGLVRVAAAVPKLHIGDPDFNAGEIIKCLETAGHRQVSILVFPEMSLPGYTVADLYFQKLLQEKTLQSLKKLVSASRRLKPLFVVGTPLWFEGKIFNTAAVIYKGEILGFVPKTYLPNYKEFYEKRWFTSGRDLINKDIEIFGKRAPVGIDLLFQIVGLPQLTIGVEICEDLWAPIPPSSWQVLRGATIIVNPSASNELIGKADYRRALISQQSARGVCGYIYTSCGPHESTTDVVFGGHAIIAENGSIIAESKRFSRKEEIIISEIDLEHLLNDRQRTTSFEKPPVAILKQNSRLIKTPLPLPRLNALYREVELNPFVPQNPLEREVRTKEIFAIQTASLASRLESANITKMIIGLSGGLDSTLALLVAVKTAELLGLPPHNIYGYTMPGFGTSKRTKQNAIRLAKALEINLKEINIAKGVLQQFQDVDHNPELENLVYENVQARYRTLTLMSKANQIRGLVIGTGDLSEIALGWNTYTGDHIAHYNVNCGVPKTLVKYLVRWVAETQVGKEGREALEDILNTPISPELIKTKNKEITQETEKIIGPYELHDFFLYHFLRWGSSPQKILFLAGLAWDKKYKEAELKKWLRVFLQRFFNSQWKRSVATDGPKIGSVSLSPRGDWRMPSDAKVKIWLANLT